MQKFVLPTFSSLIPGQMVDIFLCKTTKKIGAGLEGPSRERTDVRSIQRADHRTHGPGQIKGAEGLPPVKVLVVVRYKGLPIWNHERETNAVHSPEYRPLSDDAEFKSCSDGV